MKAFVFRPGSMVDYLNIYFQILQTLLNNETLLCHATKRMFAIQFSIGCSKAYTNEIICSFDTQRTSTVNLFLILSRFWFCCFTFLLCRSCKTAINEFKFCGWKINRFKVFPLFAKYEKDKKKDFANKYPAQNLFWFFSNKQKPMNFNCYMVIYSHLSIYKSTRQKKRCNFSLRRWWAQWITIEEHWLNQPFYLI